MYNPRTFENVTFVWKTPLHGGKVMRREAVYGVAGELKADGAGERWTGMIFLEAGRR